MKLEILRTIKPEEDYLYGHPFVPVIHNRLVIVMQNQEKIFTLLSLLLEKQGIKVEDI